MELSFLDFDVNPSLRDPGMMMSENTRASKLMSTLFCLITCGMYDKKNPLEINIYNSIPLDSILMLHCDEISFWSLSAYGELFIALTS